MNNEKSQNDAPKPSDDNAPLRQHCEGKVDEEFIEMAVEFAREKVASLQDPKTDAASVRAQIDRILQDIVLALNPKKPRTVICPVPRPKCSSCSPSYKSCVQNGGTNCSNEWQICKSCCTM